MAKSYVRAIPFLPTSRNFSELDRMDGQSFDAGDNQAAVDAMFSALRADSYLLVLLKGMNDREKIILMYQILRESGYNLNHADCAKTLSITRERYMVLLKGVRKRAGKILQTPME